MLNKWRSCGHTYYKCIDHQLHFNHHSKSLSTSLRLSNWSALTRYFSHPAIRKVANHFCYDHIYLLKNNKILESCFLFIEVRYVWSFLFSHETRLPKQLLDKPLMLFVFFVCIPRQRYLRMKGNIFLLRKIPVCMLCLYHLQSNKNSEDNSDKYKLSQLLASNL